MDPRGKFGPGESASNTMFDTISSWQGRDKTGIGRDGNQIAIRLGAGSVRFSPKTAREMAKALLKTAREIEYQPDPSKAHEPHDAESELAEARALDQERSDLDLRQAAFRKSVIPKDETMTATEMHERVRGVYRQRLIEAGMPEPSAETVATAQLTHSYVHYEDLMRNLQEIDASAAREINAAAQRERLGISREVQVGILGIREEVSDAGDLETVSSAIEAQAKILHRRSENLKVEADKLFEVVAKLRFGGVS